MNLPQDELRDFLIDKANQYAQHSFIQDDPIQIPHSYSNTKDIEISGLIAATLSWGGRKTIIAKSKNLMERMDNSPADFIRNATASDLQSFDGFVGSSDWSDLGSERLQSYGALLENPP